MTIQTIHFTEEQMTAMLIVFKFAESIKWGKHGEFEIRKYDDYIVPEVYGQNMQIENYPLSLLGIAEVLDDMNETIVWMNKSK